MPPRSWEPGTEARWHNPEHEPEAHLAHGAGFRTTMKDHPLALLDRHAGKTDPERLKRRTVTHPHILDVEAPDEASIRGIEFEQKAPDGRVFRAMLHRSTQEPGRWQFSEWGHDGLPWGHTTRATLSDALRDFRPEGYVMVAIHKDSPPPHTAFTKLPKALRTLVLEVVARLDLDVTKPERVTGQCYDVSRALQATLGGVTPEGGTYPADARALQMPDPAPDDSGDLGHGHWVCVVDWDDDGQWLIDLTAAQFPGLGWKGPRIERTERWARSWTPEDDDVFKAFGGPFTDLLKAALPVGHVSTWSDGSRWRKDAPGKWSPVGHERQLGFELTAKDEKAKEEAPLHPAKTSAFKRWFGDWEHDPEHASKVVKKDGSPAENFGPIVAYHGTGQGVFRAFSKDRTDPHALFGPGFYFTEDRDVAASYTRKNKGAAYWTVTGFEIGGRPVENINPKALAIFADRSGYWKTIVRRLITANQGKPVTATQLIGALKAEKHPNMPLDVFKLNYAASVVAVSEAIGDDANTAVRLIGKGSGGHVHEVYLNIRRPLDLDARVNDSDGQTLADNLTTQRFPGRRKLDWKTDLAGITKVFLATGRAPTWGEVYRAFTENSTNEEKRHAWRRTMRQMGYDGLTHMGGLYAGGGETLHRVWIAWEPTQVKATAAAKFDPEDEDIFKALYATEEARMLPSVGSGGRMGPFGQIIRRVGRLAPLWKAARHGAEGQMSLFGGDAPASSRTHRAGPFVGPKGGKWADPAHKVSWSDPAMTVPAVLTADGKPAGHALLSEAHQVMHFKHKGAEKEDRVYATHHEAMKDYHGFMAAHHRQRGEDPSRLEQAKIAMRRANEIENRIGRNNDFSHIHGPGLGHFLELHEEYGGNVKAARAEAERAWPALMSTGEGQKKFETARKHYEESKRAEAADRKTKTQRWSDQAKTVPMKEKAEGAPDHLAQAATHEQLRIRHEDAAAKGGRYKSHHEAMADYHRHKDAEQTALHFTDSYGAVRATRAAWVALSRAEDTESRSGEKRDPGFTYEHTGDAPAREYGPSAEHDYWREAHKEMARVARRRGGRQVAVNAAYHDNMANFHDAMGRHVRTGEKESSHLTEAAFHAEEARTLRRKMSA